VDPLAEIVDFREGATEFPGRAHWRAGRLSDGGREVGARRSV